MDDLTTFYRNALAAIIADLGRARTETADSVATERLRRMAHTLRGSGGTYGFPAITAAAARVEDATPAELSARIDDLIGVLRAVAAGESVAVKVKPAPERTIPGTGLRVLIVDDDPVARLLAVHLLGTAGHTIGEAGSAAAADAALNDARPDVILMDVVLGDEDGIDVAEALLKRALGSRPRVVFLTGATRPEQLERMNAAGAGVIRKPFDPVTFVDEFHQLVAREAQ